MGCQDTTTYFFVITKRISFSANVQPSLTPPVVNATHWSGLLSLDFPLALVYSLERTKPGFRVFGVAGSLTVSIFSLFFLVRRNPHPSQWWIIQT